MDHYQATKLETQLKGQSFKGLLIEKLLNNGKSAAVFKAVGPAGVSVALKIFDNEFLQRYGFDVQEKRINQEIALKEHGIDGLVNIIDGGYEEIGGVSYFFIIMEFIDGKNIKEYIRDCTYQVPFIKKVAGTLYEVTEQLLSHGIAHRDIKPENVMVTVDGEVILMDLGVIKPIGAPSFSDAEQKQFVGTLQYAPPEFLLRAEEDKQAAWKAINFYQIGAVLHDLVMKKEIFHDVNPFSRLVLAIKEDAPSISSGEYTYETIQLIRDLLSKDPAIRLELVSDSRLQSWVAKADEDSNELERQLEEMLQMTSGHKAEVVAIQNIRRTAEEKKQIREMISDQLEAVIDNCVNRSQANGLFRSYQKAPPFIFHSDEQFLDRYHVGNYLYDLKGDLQDGFSAPLYLFVKVDNDELSNSVIDLLGILITAADRPQAGDPLNIFRKFNWDRQGSVMNRIYNSNSLVSFNLPAYRAFRGTLGFDQQFEDKLMLDMLKIIKKAISLMADDTASELKWLRDTAGKSGKVKGRRPEPGKTCLIHEVD